MPFDKTIRRTLVIGSGSIVIGQAAEFDYAGTQACRVLRQEGVETILVNSNPATIMTDGEMADHVYIEPLTQTTLERIIQKERPDSLLPTLGGQTALNLAMRLSADGFLQRHNVRLLGCDPEAIDKAENRQRFKDTMQAIGQPVIPSVTSQTVAGALAFGEAEGYPVIVRPAFTMGGGGGGIAENRGQLADIARGGIEASPIGQILVEKSVAGYKEIEFEVMRDSAGNTIAVCSMENFDPVGVHTGDSIVAAPALTLADREYQLLRGAALAIVDALGICGGCNCQFALDPHSFDYVVIEVNPRVSRSSALASKATGYPIAKVATRVALGYTLPEIENAVTGGRTCACFEPALDYVVVKLPRWPFDKFVYANRSLGTQMKATGEMMAIGQCFEEALMKAVRGAEIGLADLNHPAFAGLSAEELARRVTMCDDERLFALYAALKAGLTVEELHQATQIDRWFLHSLANLARLEQALANGALDDALYREARQAGFTDGLITTLAGPLAGRARPLPPVYRMVDTCAAEFAADTPYFYAAATGQNEAAAHIARRRDKRETVLVLGSGPIRIGQGIEFDYACVHCVWALQRQGYQVAVVNNNPETVSTDFDIADRLYFEPLTFEDVMGVVATEKPVGVVVAFGGGTAIKLARQLAAAGVPILGTGAEGIDAAEDREQFDALLEKLAIARPRGATVHSTEEALAAAQTLGYPVLLRPSYVLGGQNMVIAFEEADITEYMGLLLPNGGECADPVLIDQYLMGTELEVDAICDGTDVLIPGVMEHVERAGVHSGDSIAVYPPYSIDDAMLARIEDCTRKLAAGLHVRGLVNIQYLVYGGELYVIEVNPRSSRTIPYLSKVTGIHMVDLATRVMLGATLDQLGCGSGIAPAPPYVAVKVPVFSFEKLEGADTLLGPEMKSTGEVLGLASTLSEALYKGLAAAGYKMEKGGGVLFSVKKSDRPEIAALARRFARLGCTLYATKGNARELAAAGLAATVVQKLSTGDETILRLMEEGSITCVVSTSAKGRLPGRDSVRIRRKAVARGIPCLTSLDTANALAECMESHYSLACTQLVDMNHRRAARMALPFAKLQTAGNDYLCFDCREAPIDNPAGLGVRLCRAHYGVGGEGIALLLPSDKADFRMETYNLDGSEGEAAGNALRMLAAWACQSGIVPKTQMTVESKSGVHTVGLRLQNGVPYRAFCDMGTAIVGQTLDVGGGRQATCVDVGNPHAVVFAEGLDAIDLAAEGGRIENAKAFPGRANVEFVQVLAPDTLRARVWERGSGETMACGTGACAAVAAAVAAGRCRPGRVRVQLPGGDLWVTCTSGGALTLESAVSLVFRGSVEV